MSTKNNDLFGLSEYDFMSEEDIQYELITNMKLQKDKIIKNTGKIKKELLEMTWHPTRVIDWCIDIETKKRILYLFGS